MEIRVKRSLENLDKCLCMQCPSYTGHCKIKNAPENFLKLMENFEHTDHYEKMFCAYERSNCIYQRYGCLCSICEVAKKYNLQKQSYCLHTGGM